LFYPPIYDVVPVNLLH